MAENEIMLLCVRVQGGVVCGIWGASGERDRKVAARHHVQRRYEVRCEPPPF